MTCPLIGRSEGSSDDITNSHVVVDVIGGPAAAPTLMDCALVTTLTMGASLVRKISVAPESNKAVVRLSSLARQREANFRISLSHFAGPFKGVLSLTESGGTCTRGGLLLVGETKGKLLSAKTLLHLWFISTH